MIGLINAQEKAKPMRHRIGLAAVALLAVIMTGCGSVRATPAAPARPAGLAAAAAATAARTSRVSVSLTMGAPGMWVTLTGTGAFDYASSRGWLRLGGSGAALEERFLPPRMYVKLPGSMPGAHGKTWLAATLSGAGAGAVPLMFPGPQADPATLLAALTGATGGRKDLGQTTIQGVPVTHYQVSIGVGQAVAKAPAAARARLRAVLGTLGVRAFPADVWVDRGGLVRRIEIKVAPAGAGGPGGRGAATTETVTFYGFGVPVTVTAPPAGQVISLPALGAKFVSSFVSTGVSSRSRPTASPAG